MGSASLWTTVSGSFVSARPDSTIDCFAAAGIGLQAAGELRDRVGGFVGERRRAALGGQIRRHAERVFAALDFDTLERMALGLGFDHADHLAAGVKQVIHGASLQRKLPYRDTWTGAEVYGLVILHDPARGRELAVDFLSCVLFGRQALARKVFGLRILAQPSE